MHSGDVMTMLRLRGWGAGSILINVSDIRCQPATRATVRSIEWTDHPEVGASFAAVLETTQVPAERLALVGWGRPEQWRLLEGRPDAHGARHS